MLDQGQGQGHTLRLVVLTFPVCSISPKSFEGFSLNIGKLLASVRQTADPMCQHCKFKVKVTTKGQQCPAEVDTAELQSC